MTIVAGAVALESTGKPRQFGLNERARLDRDSVRVELVVVAGTGGADDETATATMMFAVKEAEGLAASTTFVCCLVRLPSWSKRTLLESGRDVRANAGRRLVRRNAEVGCELRREDRSRRGDGSR